jgi:hypothetical protein
MDSTCKEMGGGEFEFQPYLQNQQEKIRSLYDCPSVSEARISIQKQEVSL